jgi:hypothetical protein
MNTFERKLENKQNKIVCGGSGVGSLPSGVWIMAVSHFEFMQYQLK